MTKNDIIATTTTKQTNKKQTNKKTKTKKGTLVKARKAMLAKYVQNVIVIL